MLSNIAVYVWVSLPSIPFFPIITLFFLILKSFAYLDKQLTHVSWVNETSSLW